ncbi:MAG: YIP1 family protein [Nitrospirae bacterium]|nr:YIP1 family protein [Nitrospirota bacterium]
MEHTNGQDSSAGRRMEKEGGQIEVRIRDALASLPETVVKVITEPARFFREMPRTGGLVEPLAFLMVMNVISASLQSVLNLFHIGIVPALLPSLVVVAAVPFLTIIFGFLVSSILFVIWYAMGSRLPFEAAFRCLAYMSAISPLTVLLSAIPLAGGVIGLGWTAYLAIIASKEVHSVKAWTAWIVFGFIFVVFSLFSIGAEITGHRLTGTGSELHQSAEEDR